MNIKEQEVFRLKELFTPAEFLEALNLDWEDSPIDEDIWNNYAEELLEILEDY